MQILLAGGNAGIDSSQIQVDIEWSPVKIGGDDVDASAFLITEKGEVRSDADFIFYNQPESKDGSVKFTASEAKNTFHINTAAIPSEISKIALAITIHGNATFSQSANVSLKISNSIIFSPDISSMKERALIVAELYKRNGAWKIRAIGQGFSGGLGPLATRFGVDIESPQKQTPPVPPVSVVPPPIPPPKQKTNINLCKISLEKKGDFHTISLKKEGIYKEIKINLNWTAHPAGAPKSGLLGRVFGNKIQEIDLDLGCFLELHGGLKTCIDGLQFAQDRGPRNQLTRQGCFTSQPWIWHMGDDRTGGQSESGKTILVNPEGFKDIKRIIVYTFICEGAARWGEANAIATVSVPDSPDIIVEMGSQSNQNTFCSLATIDFLGSNQIRVTRNVTFHKGYSDCNDEYGWRMSFKADGVVKSTQGA